MIKRVSEKLFAYSMLVPTMAFVVIIIIVPIIYSMYVSTHHWYYIKPQDIGKWAGLQNYTDVITSPTFLNSLKVTLTFTFWTLGLELSIGMLIALMLNESFRGKRVVYALIIIPWAIPNVAIGIMWKWIYNPKFGALNGALYSTGILPEYISWLGNPKTALYMIIVAMVWKQLPLVVFLLYAGLQAIPVELYSAAKVDGAGPWSRFTNVTFVWLKPSMMIALIIQTMNSLRTFDMIFVMTEGGPGDATSVIAWYTYYAAFRAFNFGQGSSLSYLLTLGTIVFTVLYVRFLYVRELA